MYTVYVLYSRLHGQTYVGQTNDLSARLARHNAGQVTSTRRYIPWEVIHTERFETRSAAVRRERWLKSGVGRAFIKRLVQVHT
jgi:putative endonuclease